jgi:DNA ligase-1
MGRELLQLAHPYNPTKDRIGGCFISEKLDGTRCFWDGGVSRGVPTEEIPWAGIIDPATGRKKAKLKPIATGLWSRYGNPIIAPDEFLDRLPSCLLDGELWAGRGNFQLCRSICGGDAPDPRFMSKIAYVVYSAPRTGAVFEDGEIKNANMWRMIDFAACQAFIHSRPPLTYPPSGPFIDELKWLNERVETQADSCYVLRQEQLPPDEAKARIRFAEFFDFVLEQGGEGVVLRDPNALWKPKRHRGILKYKPYRDAEATIVGFTSGRETEKGSRLLGMIGALIVDYKGKRLELAGLTDAERAFLNPSMSEAARSSPGEDMPRFFQGECFKVGQTVTFKYRELSDGGIPKDARYWRRRDVE